MADFVIRVTEYVDFKQKLLKFIVLIVGNQKMMNISDRWNTFLNLAMLKDDGKFNENVEIIMLPLENNTAHITQRI